MKINILTLRKIYILLSVCLILPIGVTIYAQEQLPDNSENSQFSILWEISREDLSFKSYLFGTYHAVSSNMIDTCSVITCILNEITQVITEVGDDEIDTASLLYAAQMKIDEYYSFNDSAKEKMVENYLYDNFGQIAHMYYRIKPMFWYFLIQYDFMSKLNSSPNAKSFLSIDEYFLRKGLEMNKKVDGFETYDEQIALLFDSISVKRQCEMLTDYVNNIQINNRYINFLDTCYKKLDAECLSNLEIYKLYNTEEKKLFLDNRNLRWVKEIPYYINNNPSLIAVGFAHLHGSNGLIELLRKQGYTLKPIHLN